MTRLDTIRVVDPGNPEGFLTINASDFDPAVHTRWVAPPAPADAPPPGAAGETAGSELLASSPSGDGEASDQTGPGEPGDGEAVEDGTQPPVASKTSKASRARGGRKTKPTGSQ